MLKPRGVLVAGNWKMNQTVRETEQFFDTLRNEIPKLITEKDQSCLKDGSLRACIFPSYLSLAQAQTEAFKLPFPLSIGAQNAHWEKKGAFTGEVSGPMLQELGIEWVIIGHSERRQFFGETDLTVKKRTESLLEQGFKVILCIGETQAERQTGKTAEVLSRQLSSVFPESGSAASGSPLNPGLFIAYEPVWAIGTGVNATPAQAEEAHQLIRRFFKDRFGASASDRLPILYGGSVTPENMGDLLSCPDIDGALVGGASLKPVSFLKMLKWPLM